MNEHLNVFGDLSTSDPKPVLPVDVWSRAPAGTQARTTPDRYGYYPRAYAAARLILDGPAPFTMAVLAEWGRGKTVLLQTIEYILEQTNPGVHVLRYQPWQFRLTSFEDIWLSMIEEIRDQVQDLAAGSRTASQGWQPSDLEAFLSGSQEAVGLSVLKALGETNLPYAAGLAGVAAGILARPKPMHAHFDEFRNSLQKLAEAAGKRRVMLIVDDIDRCEPNMIVEVLRAVHVFARCSNLITVLAFDRDVVSRSLASRYDTTEQANEYIHKVVQLSVTPPRVMGSLSLVLRGSSQELQPSGIPPGDRKYEGIPAVPLERWAPQRLDEKWLGFLARSLCYNPRMFHKFDLICRFRWSVAEVEYGREKNEIKTAVQAVIEIRWPEWNWVAYRFPDAERAFKGLFREAGGAADIHARRTLEEQYPVLRLFLENQALCGFYSEYYRMTQ